MTRPPALCPAQDEQPDAALACCQPALAAIGAGAHKRLAWDSALSPVPNPCSCLNQQQQQQHQQQHQEAGQAAQEAGQAAASAQAEPAPAAPAPAEPTAAPACACIRRPLFLARFSAAWVYAGMATCAVSLLEAARRYQEAGELLQALLGGNACPARRGYWWLRLSIDLEHAGQSDSALEVRGGGGSDPLGAGGVGRWREGWGSPARPWQGGGGCGSQTRHWEPTLAPHPVTDPKP